MRYCALFLLIPFCVPTPSTAMEHVKWKKIASLISNCFYIAKYVEDQAGQTKDKPLSDEEITQHEKLKTKSDKMYRGVLELLAHNAVTRAYVFDENKSVIQSLHYAATNKDKDRLIMGLYNWERRLTQHDLIHRSFFSITEKKPELNDLLSCSESIFEEQTTKEQRHAIQSAENCSTSIPRSAPIPIYRPGKSTPQAPRDPCLYKNSVSEFGKQNGAHLVLPINGNAQQGN